VEWGFFRGMGFFCDQAWGLWNGVFSHYLNNCGMGVLANLQIKAPRFRIGKGML
jgi:hypothetical protein